MDFCVSKLNESHLVALKYHAMDVSAFLLSQFTSYVNDFLGPAGYKFFLEIHNHIFIMLLQALTTEELRLVFIKDGIRDELS